MLWFALSFAAIPAGGGHAQDAPPRTIQSVEYTGLSRTPADFVRGVAGIEAGGPLDASALDAAIARLLRTGRFLTATYRLEDADEGVRVVFAFTESAFVRFIRFEGNKHFGDSPLRDLVSQKPDQPADWFAIRDGVREIEASYHEAGYPEVSVSFDRDRVEQSGELVYSIQEGARVRIREIRFEGNQALTDRQLRRRLATKKAFWIFRTGAFDKERVAADARRIESYYRDEGFLDAKAGFRTELGDGGERMTLVFVVEEGTRYRIESIELRGNTRFSTEELLDRMQSREGEIVKRPQIDADVREIQRLYQEHGFIYAEARGIRVFSHEPGLVRVTIEITEGEPYRVGRVAVRGNTRTQDKVVRRALNLYPPDDLFDLTEAREAERRLLETRIFQSARVYPVGDAQGVRDIVMDVREADKAGDFLFGAGITSNSGLVGNIVLDLQNFDLFDVPRSWSELIRFRSFFGAGQRLRIEVQPGTNVSRFRVDFTEPYLLDKPLRFDFSAYLFERGRDGYDEQRGGATVSFGKRFERGVLRGWSGEIALRAENVRINDIDLFTARRIREDAGSNWESSIKGTLVRDRTDNRFIPTTGDRLRLGYQQFGALGGTNMFGKVTAGYSRFRTLYTDLLDRKHVLELRAEVGANIGDAPIYERFYAGGTGSIRGFAYRGVGPREGIDKNNVGGDYSVLLGTEYSFPVVGENIRGLLFLDSGAVGPGAWRASIGTGVRFTVDIFGPVPFELDLAIPISADSEDDKQVFSFVVGRIF